MVGVYFFTKHKFADHIGLLTDNLQNANRELSNRPSIRLSFSECNDIINDVVDDIWKNKYFIAYRLKEVSVIPAMDEEITSFVKEVVDALSEDVIKESCKYYSYDYIIKKITRQGQMLFIDYTNNYKPNAK